MSLRNGQRILIKDWRGLNSFASKQNLPPDYFYDSDNVIITNDGSAACLRSADSFNDALSLNTTGAVYSAFDYAKTSGHLILFDVNWTVGVNSVHTYALTNGTTTNTLIRSNQAADKSWKRLTINDWCYGLNGAEFVQTQGTSTFYAVGITSPGTAPLTAFTTVLGVGSVVSGMTVSYAYRNSATGHVSAPSPVSLATGTSQSNTAIQLTPVASSQTGVDGLVWFFTEDGGVLRYLFIDANGAPVVTANTATTVTLSLASLTSIDTLTPEPVYNLVPPQDAYFMFRWRDRICLTDFRDNAAYGPLVQFSALESCFVGVPQESYPPLNLLQVTAKGDKARSGVETPVGGLVLGETDSYLIRGELSDKTTGPESTASVTEAIQPLNWSIGTRSPKTLVSTPFGVIWLDQNKRLQLWNYEGFPTEVGLPIRSSLVDIGDTDNLRGYANACWFQHGKTGGHYALIAYTTSTSLNKLFVVSLYRDPETGEPRTACAVSSIGGNCVFAAVVSGAGRCFVGSTLVLKEVLDLDREGDGWLSTQTRYFKLMIGNDSEFNYWHSLRFDATSICGLRIFIANMDGTEEQEVLLEQDSGGGGAYYGALDAYGFRKSLEFRFDARDGEKRIIQNLRVAYSAKARLL